MHACKKIIVNVDITMKVQEKAVMLRNKPDIDHVIATAKIIFYTAVSKF